MTLFHLLRILLLGVGAGAADEPAGVDQSCDIWVSASRGHDGPAAGRSPESPLRSLQAAASLLRALGCSGNTTQARQANATVHVSADGNYAYRPLALGAADSNAAWRCDGGGGGGGGLCEVSGSAAVGVPGATWTVSRDARLPPGARGAVLEVALGPSQRALIPAPATTRTGGNHTALFYRGAAMQRARYPNVALRRFQAGPATNWSVIPRAGDGPADECLAWSDGDDRPARWAAAGARGDLALHGMFYVLWKDSLVGNVTVDPARRLLCRDGGFPSYGVAAGGVWFATNLAEELDAPGEYVLDRARGVLLFWPPPDAGVGGAAAFDPLAARISAATSALVLTPGTANVSFAGFGFRHTRGAAVAATGPQRFELDRCAVSDAGGEGVSLGATPGTDVRASEPPGSGHRVTNCTVRRTGLAGVVVSCGRRETLAACGALVSDNDISDFGRVGYTYSAGVAVAGVGVLVAHNRVRNGYHLGLACAGNDHAFRRNIVSDVALETWDTGALYAGGDWSFYNNSARENLFLNVGRPGVHCNAPTTACERHMVYLDEWASGWSITGNAFVNAGEDTGFFFSHDGRDNTFANNIMVNSTRGGLVARFTGESALTPAMNATLFGELERMPFQRPPWSTRYPRLAALPYDSPALAKGNAVACNVAVDMAGRPAVCFGRGYAHNSPNECINRDGYLSLQVLYIDDASCFNVSGPSLATNSSPATVFVSPRPQDSLDFRLLPSARQALPCFEPFPTDVGPRALL